MKSNARYHGIARIFKFSAGDVHCHCSASTCDVCCSTAFRHPLQLWRRDMTSIIAAMATSTAALATFIALQNGASIAARAISIALRHVDVHCSTGEVHCTTASVVRRPWRRPSQQLRRPLQLCMATPNAAPQHARLATFGLRYSFWARPEVTGNRSPHRIKAR
jgi:hypothetical protein